jgi:hypothetical protein
MRAQEGRKRAIDVESALSSSERKRSKTALETRVVKACSLCDAAINAAYKELIRASFDEYAEDKIDAAEMERRKKAAREKAASEHPPLQSLDTGVRRLLLLTSASAVLASSTPQTRSALSRALAAYRTYTAKVAARVAAEKALAAAETAEEEAEAAVEAAVRAIEGQGAGFRVS